MASKTPTASDTVPLIAGTMKDYDTLAEKRPLKAAELQQGRDDDDESDTTASSQQHKTTVWQTFIHLLKGYIGVGCLSLPWAVSQLGLYRGFIAIYVMSYWSSYNCWTVVKIKRYIEHKAPPDDESEKHSETSSNITYPDVGEFLYGQEFQSYVAACICIQQLAICTVFLSFIGENLLAVLTSLDINNWALLTTHFGVITLALPLVMALSFLPSLKSLSPVMAAGTVCMLVSFAVLFLIVAMKWNDRPTEPIQTNVPQVPIALCAILYSYEGICLILPIESAMKEPRYFAPVFWGSMSLVALILGLVATFCVLAFGLVDNGSVTAFLLQAYRQDESITWWLMLANTAVSLSVLLTYPLQLFPALEIIGPAIANKFRSTEPEEEENDLEGFEPLPPLPEHDVASVDSIPEMSHHYDDDGDEQDDNDSKASSSLAKDGGDDESDILSAVSVVMSMFPELPMPGDSPQLRAGLVFMTYMVAVVVPNVQALISLAGAVAGSSTALLIPPLLELAYIRHLEKTNMSPTSKRTREVVRGKWWWPNRLKNYVLFILGLVFMAIGTYASIADIIAIYRG